MKSFLQFICQIVTGRLFAHLIPWDSNVHLILHFIPKIIGMLIFMFNLCFWKNSKIINKTNIFNPEWNVEINYFWPTVDQKPKKIILVQMGKKWSPGILGPRFSDILVLKYFTYTTVF